MTKPAVQTIDPREIGLRALDLRQPVFGPDAVARADETLKAMAGAMKQWIDADLARLQTLRLEAEAAHWDATSTDAVMCAAHDLKGLGATYGFPLVTSIAASLCRLTETNAGKAAVAHNPALVRAHVDALRAIVRDGIRAPNNPLGLALKQTLEAEVAKLGVAPR
ncbi:MAG: Hpt domain-containing protein [Proteobacteria bacterium]|nr:Hpt domain-containing protein [Pseudomonadota bacterium]